MIEEPDKLGYEIWDDPDFTIPEEFHLDKNSTIYDALRVFYAAGGYDFFRVIDPAKYADNWLMYIGDLYADIEDGKYKSDGNHYTIPLTENERDTLIKQGVPEIFTKDF